MNFCWKKLLRPQNKCWKFILSKLINLLELAIYIRTIIESSQIVLISACSEINEFRDSISYKNVSLGISIIIFSILIVIWVILLVIWIKNKENLVINLLYQFRINQSVIKTTSMKFLKGQKKRNIRRDTHFTWYRELIYLLLSWYFHQVSEINTQGL